MPAPSAEEQRRFEDAARSDGLFTFDSAILIVAAAAIATFGLLENNVAVIIGAMIIAPLIQPIASLSFAIVSGEVALLRRSAISLAVEALTAVFLAAVITRLAFLPILGSEIVARSQPNLLDLGVALAAGLVTAFARIRPGIAGTIAGTAIAVALMPPLCVAGIGLAGAQWTLALGAALLFATNLFGIMLASMGVYVFSGYAHVRRAGHGLFWTALATAAIIVPLAISTGELIRQVRLESDLRTALLKGTVTFQRVELVRADFNWVISPPEVHMLVRSAQPITPGQVRLLEAFAKRKTGTDFRFVFDVTRVEEVKDMPAPSGTDTPKPFLQQRSSYGTTQAAEPATSNY